MYDESAILTKSEKSTKNPGLTNSSMELEAWQGHASMCRGQTDSLPMKLSGTFKVPIAFWMYHEETVETA
jgi:hypothetical protein